MIVLFGALSVWASVCRSIRSLIVGGAVLAVAQITMTLIVLGLLSQLNRPSVLLLNLALGVLQIILGRTALLRAFRGIAGSLIAGTRFIFHSPLMMISLGMLLLAMLMMLWLGVVLPPTDWDGLAQNLPMAAFHLQEGNIWPIETPYRGIQAYPQGGALLLAYVMLLAGNDLLADLVQFPFWLLGTCAIFALARELGAGRSASFLGALLFAAAPVTMLQARAAYFDLEVAALSLALLALALDRKLDAVWRSLIVGAGMGLLIGLKYAGVIHALIILTILVGVMVSDKVAGKRVLLLSGGALLACVAIGGWWYFFNFAYHQNSFWPMQVQLGGRVLLPGVWTTDEFYQGALPASLAEMSGLYRLITIWQEPASHYTADMRLGGLGPLWFVFGVPGLVVFAVQTIRRPSVRGWSVLFYIVATFLLTPANWHTRYVLASVGAGGACVAVMLDAFDGIGRRALVVTIVGLASLTLLIVPAHGEATVADVVRNSLLTPALRRTVLMDRVPAMDEALRWSELNIPAGSTVAYGWGGVVLYPLFGSGLQNKLVWIDPDPNRLNVGLRGKECPQYTVVRAGSAEEANAVLSGAPKIFASNKYIVFKVVACE